MTPRELEILHTVYQLGGQASLGGISKKTGLSLVYSHGLAKALLRQHLLDQSASRLLVLTVQGRLLVERRGTVNETAVLGLTEAAHLVSRQTGIAPTLPSETNFLNTKLIEEPVSLARHDLNKNQTVELADARSIQAGIDGLISINSLPKVDPPLADKRSKRRSVNIK